MTRRGEMTKQAHFKTIDSEHDETSPRTQPQVLLADERANTDRFGTSESPQGATTKRVTRCPTSVMVQPNLCGAR